MNNMFNITEATIINLCPHKATLVLEGKTLEIAPSGNIARVASEEVLVGYIMGIPIYDTVYGDVTGLPDSEDGVFYFVSRLVKSACPNRADLLVPGGQVRDDNGNIVGCKGLARS